MRLSNLLTVVAMTLILVSSAVAQGPQVQQLSGSSWTDSSRNDRKRIAKVDFGEGTYNEVAYFVFEINNVTHRVKKSDVKDPMKRQMQAAVDKDRRVIIKFKSGEIQTFAAL